MNKTPYDDGGVEYLVEGASFVGSAGIPELMAFDDYQIPNALLPIERMNITKDKRQFLHFYQHDKSIRKFIVSAPRYLYKIQEFDGIISPDYTLAIGQSRCIQESNVYYNRAVGYFYQRHGVPVIPNARWADKETFDFCFLGIPKNQIVCVSTLGCIHSKEQKRLFREGLDAMLHELQPTDVLVHGVMPDTVFGQYTDQVDFHRYPSHIEEVFGVEKEEY